MATPDISQRSVSPVVPAAAPFVRPISTLPVDYQFPQTALTKEMHQKLCKLSALAKGYLVRKLMKTIKVQALISSMKDTMNMALQLHHEARQQQKGVQKEDIDLHRRLLQQLNKDSQEFHNVFFALATKEKMAILALDSEVKMAQEERSQRQDFASNARRLSAATKAKIERQQKLAEMEKEGIKEKPRRKRWSLQDKENREKNTCH